MIDDRYPGAVYFVETAENMLALTIDDGPDAVTTPKILEVLQQYQARATFFLISDRVEGNEAIVRQIVEQGHELGNHLTRDEASIKLKNFGNDLLEADAILSKFAPLRWLRPGQGLYNSSMVKVAHQHGYRIALGSIFPYDTTIPVSWFATQQILCNARPGAIIILHDSHAWGKRTAETLSAVLPELNNRGYQVVTLSKLYDANQE